MAKKRKKKAAKKPQIGKGAYGYCGGCGSRKMINGHCKICGSFVAEASSGEKIGFSEAGS